MKSPISDRLGLLPRRYGIFGELGAALLSLRLRFVMVSVSIFRLSLCFAAIGVSAPIREGWVFAVSGVAGASVSIAPAKLGKRELVAPGFTPLASIDAATTFITTARDRLLELILLFASAAPFDVFVRRTRSG